MEKIFPIEVGVMQNICYVVSSGLAVIIDPGFEADKILKVVNKNKLKVKYILITHAHFDHVRAVLEIKHKTNAKVLCHARENYKYTDETIYNEEEIEVGKMKIKVIETPGHSLGGCCFLINEKYLFTGDTLFVKSHGRTDFSGGNHKEIIHSLKKLFKLPSATIIYPGHDYNGEKSTIGEEKKFFEENVF
ncbi:MAG: MBL fold metallo-hydrolase [Nanoarchaeota archaeon]|nr:MBL fold metallo-hydrolase [Nanoarchaeota archaeon]